MKFAFFSRTLICLSASLAAALANDPGGGQPTGGRSVSLSDLGQTVVLENESIRATVRKDNANIVSLVFNGVECVRNGGNIYFSMDGGDDFRPLRNCVYSITSANSDMVDISMRQNWTTSLSQPLDVEIHYVLRRGDTGIYSYALLHHRDTYPAGEVFEWRMVWKLPDDTFENLFVDDLRNRRMPNAVDYESASTTNIPEVLKLNSGPLAGEFEGKYCYNVRYQDSPAFGHASDNNNTGVWFVMGSQEWFNDGPFKQDLGPADRILHLHFGRNHYYGSRTELVAGETWSKCFGPYLLYCNTDPAGAEACWEDAQRQAEAEQAAWPYDWLQGNSEYPSESERGSVSGTIDLNDPLKPTLDATNAWVGLAQPEPGGNFQFESRGYQHWTRAEDNGVFTIPHVRPGTYRLYCIAEGATGEFELSADVVVGAGEEIDLGVLDWNIERVGNRLAWEIGIPDRDSTEFRHGDDFFVPFTWERFHQEFTNPLLFDVSKSSPSESWNYAHPGFEEAGGPPRKKWPWHIRFDLPELPDSGAARLTLALAGSAGARMKVFVNSQFQFGPEISPEHNGGNAFVRQGSHAKYSLHRIDIPLSDLRTGANVITLLQDRINLSSTLNSDHVLYDYVGLEFTGLPEEDTEDLDRDYLDDSWELLHFRTLTFTAREDNDGDGFNNAAEQAGQSDPNDPESLPSDLEDNDLIDDEWETSYYPSSFSAGPLDDTDADGFNTWTEWKWGTDPTSAESRPVASGESIYLTPVADTTLWYRNGSEDYAASNHGNDVDLDNYSYPSVPIIALGYLRFDLNALPTQANILTASLQLAKISPNPEQSPQGLHSTKNGDIVQHRFSIYGLHATAGNTAQDWNEYTLTGASAGLEFDPAMAGTDPPVDTASRTIDLDGDNEFVTTTSASISGPELLGFLQSRVDSGTSPGLATFITDMEDGSDGKGYAFASREGPAGMRPLLTVSVGIEGTPPSPDEDGDSLPDAWEAEHFSTLANGAESDFDGDGTPEWLEEVLGLDPRDPMQSFRLSISKTADTHQLEWRSGAGMVSTVQTSTELREDSWSDLASIPGQENQPNLTFDIDLGEPRKFYRIQVEPAPNPTE